MQTPERPLIKTDFLETLLTVTATYDIPLSEEQANACHEHVSLMLAWNRTCNLTRITDLREIIESHLLDSLLPARWLPQAGPALDLGTGPGFPGIPLAILYPGLEMHLLESHRRKVSFLKVVLARLALPNLKVVEGRWEDLVRSSRLFLQKPLRLVTMRAVKLEPAHLTRFAPELLQEDGVFAYWAGPGTDLPGQEDLNEKLAATGMVFDGRHSYSLPSIPQPRHLFRWRKRCARGPGLAPEAVSVP